MLFDAHVSDGLTHYLQDNIDADSDATSKERYVKITNFFSIDRHWLLILAVAAMVIGCGGGGASSAGSSGAGNNTTPLEPSETVAPTVTAMTPREDTTGLGTNGRLTATFSEAMTSAGITPANFRVTDEEVFISGTVSYDDMNHIAVFSPDSSLAPDTRYTATIITGIKDTSGNPLVTDFAWCFITGSSNDNSNPDVLSTIPGNSATDVALNSKLIVNFSKEMNSMTLTSENFSLTGPGSVIIAGTVKYLNRSAVFTPVNNLAANTGYTVMLLSNISDLSGNTLLANKTWNFSTGITTDGTAPVVIGSNPASDELGVDISRYIHVTFDKPMDPDTVTTANILVTGPGETPVTGTILFDYATNTATFERIKHLNTPVAFHPVPVSNLDPNTTYTVRLTKDLKDIYGNIMANDSVWKFTTAM